MKNRILFIIALFLIYSCGKHENKEEHKEFHSIVEKIEYLTNDSIEYSISSKEIATYVESVPFLGENNDTIAFIPKRTNEIKSFPCSNCHGSTIEEIKTKIDPNKKKAHWNIELVHADNSVMTCTTCHNNDNPNELITITENTMSFDQSVNICAQCHSNQFKDWKGGAHGKKLGAWVPPKLINSCVNCHNPHTPSFKSRWPARLNTQKITELND